MSILGYARTSSTDQSLDVQLTQLKGAGCTKVFQEQESGAKTNRPQLAALLSYARDGDVVVVTKLDRLARSMVDFWKTWEVMSGRGVTLRILNMPGMDTSTAHGQLIMGVLASVAQFERTLIRERQADGIAAAKAKGIYMGREPISAEKQKQIREMAALGVPKTIIARKLKIGRTTVHKWLRGGSQQG